MTYRSIHGTSPSTYSHVSPAFPTWHPDDGCGLLPRIVWMFRPFVPLQSAGGRFRFLVPPSGTICLSTSHLRRHWRFSDNDSRPFCFPVPTKTLSYDWCVTITIHHYCLDTCICNYSHYLGLAKMFVTYRRHCAVVRETVSMIASTCACLSYPSPFELAFCRNHGAVIWRKIYASFYFCRQPITFEVIMYGTLLFYEHNALVLYLHFVILSAVMNYLLSTLSLDFGGRFLGSILRMMLPLTLDKGQQLLPLFIWCRRLW